MREKVFWVFLVVLLFDVVVIPSINPNVRFNPVQALLIPNLTVDPPETVDPLLVIGQEFTVSLNISNAEGSSVGGLYGVQAKISFNREVVNCTAIAKIVPGPFWEDWFPEDYLFRTSIDYNAGYVLVAGSKISTTPGGAYGDGILAYITFTVIANQRATLLQYANLGGEGGTYLRTLIGGVPVPLEPFTAQDGIFDNRGGPNTPPVADFSVLPLEATKRGEVSFDASASYDPDAWIVSYEWDYGDGKSEIYLRERLKDVNLTTTSAHTYSLNGTYSVTLTVEDSDGAVAVTSSQVAVQFDIAVTNVESSSVAVFPGTIVTINVTVANYGDFNEAFNLTASYDETVIGTQEILSLAAQTQEAITFTWNTTDVGYGQYALKANASIVEGEVNVANNEYVNGFVTIIAPDVAVTSVESPFMAVMPGTVVTVNVTVVNYGDFIEACNVTAYYNSTVIDTIEVTGLFPLEQETFTFYWDTTGVDYGKYILKANASIVDGEDNVANNGYINGFVTIGQSNVINYPVAVAGVTFNIVVESTSSTSAFSFNRAQKKIGFNVTGEFGWFTNVTIPMALLNVSSPDAWMVNFNGSSITYTPSSNGTHYFIYFNYTLSAQTRAVEIIGETVATPPNANYAVSKTTAIAGESITFDASTSYDPDGIIEGWEWDFGDGNTATGEVVQHSFLAHGAYIVTLTVRDNVGLTNSTQKTITIIDYPIASYTYSPEEPLVDQIMTFDATASNPVGGTIEDWEWDFGDGEVGIGEIVQHSFATNGTYTVTLTVRDDENLTNSTQKTITIIDYPIADFSYLPSEPLVNQTITFNAAASNPVGGTITEYAWKFGDGLTGNGGTATHSYLTTGTFTVNLTVTDSEGLTNSTTKTVTVRIHDIALTSLTATPGTVRMGEIVTIQLTVDNNGNFTESFSVTVYYHDTTDVTVETKLVTNLAGGGSQPLAVQWNTSSVGPKTYTIRAETSDILGETRTQDNTISDVVVTVQKKISSLTVDASSTTVTLGSSTTFTGTLTPTLQGKTITLQYRLVGQSWGTLNTPTTDTRSKYQFLWTPTSVGTYEIQATWQGDANTEAGQSQIRTITVEEAEAQAQGIPTQYIAIGLIVAFVIIAVVVYIFRVRKR